jgi:hypothetical protein
MDWVALCAAWGVFAQPPQAQLRGNGGSVPEQMLFRVVNNAPFPVNLVNCANNLTVAASHATTQAYASFAELANTSFFWVVPEGESVDCNSGCPECYYVAFGLEAAGGLVMRLGFETDDTDDEPWEEFAKNDTSGPAEKAGASDAPDGAVTGLELVVSRASDRVRESAACGPSFCSPGWERDHLVAWNTTIDLVIAGSSEMQGLTTPSSVGHIESLGRWYRRRRVYRRRFYRPAVWRRPIWRRPIYPVGYCLFCSRFCLWRCR